MTPIGITASSLVGTLTRVFTSSQNFTLPFGFSNMSVFILADGCRGDSRYIYADPGDSNGDGNYENTGQQTKRGGNGGNLRYALNKPFTPGQSLNMTKASGEGQLNEVIINGSTYMTLRNASSYGGITGSFADGTGGDGVRYGGAGDYRDESQGDYRRAAGGGAAGTTGNGGNAGIEVPGVRGSGISFTDADSGIVYTNGAGQSSFGGGGYANGYYDSGPGYPGFIALVFS